MKPVAVKKSTNTGRSLHKYKGMEKSKKPYVKHLNKVLNQVHPTTIQQHWALDQLSANKAGSTLCSLVALEAARLSCSQPRNKMTSKEICTALKNLHSARHKDL